MDTDALNARIGQKIRALRGKNGLTQQELADRTELTKGYISQLEHGQVTPALPTLMDLIECLGSTAAEFFREAEEVPTVFRASDFFEKKTGKGSTLSFIVPPAQKNRMEPLLVELSPYDALEKDEPHDGEEFGFVLCGSLRLHLGQRTFTVRSGESFYYLADRVHFIENRTSRPARFLWISTPPSF